MSQSPRGIFRVGETETGRVEAFSDGVLAIVITLLVLEIKPPSRASLSQDELWSAIAAALPAIGAWVVSFVFVFTFWVAHHYFFGQIERADRGLLWLNGLFLLTISFTPYPTALVAAFPLATPSTFLLSLAMWLTACSFALMRWYALYVAKLLPGHIDRALLRHGMRRALISPTLYLIAMVAAFIWPLASLAIQFVVPIVYFFPGKLETLKPDGK